MQLCTSSPEQAAEFVKQVDVTCLAVLVGNAHGHYKKPPKLDIERIAAIRKKTGGIPLVLHGGSGIPDDQVKAAINAGIRKMNIGTDVCCAFADGRQRTAANQIFTRLLRSCAAEKDAVRIPQTPKPPYAFQTVWACFENSSLPNE